MAKIECNLNINGISKKVTIHEDKPLIYVLRDEFGLTGTKLGCGLELCGCCAILIDGKKKADRAWVLFITPPKKLYANLLKPSVSFLSKNLLSLPFQTETCA